MVIIEGDAAGDLRASMVRLGSVDPLLEKLGDHAMNSMKKNIEESRSPEGVTFDELKHPRRAGHPYGNKPLLDSTNMYQSIHYEKRGSAEVFAGPSFEQAEYFPFVNQGRPRKGVPPRTFIGVRSEDNDAFSTITAEHIERAFATR